MIRTHLYVMIGTYGFIDFVYFPYVLNYFELWNWITQMTNKQNWQLINFRRPSSILWTKILTYQFLEEYLMYSFERRWPLTLRLIGTFLWCFEVLSTTKRMNFLKIKSKSSLRKTAWKVESKMNKVQKYKRIPDELKSVR